MAFETPADPRLAPVATGAGLRTNLNAKDIP